jgi:hypothetical protein
VFAGVTTISPLCSLWWWSLARLSRWNGGYSLKHRAIYSSFYQQHRLQYAVDCGITSNAWRETRCRHKVQNITSECRPPAVANPIKENYHDTSHCKPLQPDSQPIPGDRPARRRCHRLGPDQTSESVTIPFAFSAYNQSIAAGSYKVELLSDRFLSLRNVKTNDTQILLVRPEEGQAMETRGRLVFHQQGTRKYLTQVWIAGTSKHSEIAFPQKPERELAKSRATADSTVELAIK